MLAYLFWHWREAQIEPQAYQDYLLHFHQVLATHRAEGFHTSRVFLLEQAPWVGRSEQTYEDWYIVENSAALDLLNEGAVSGFCKEPHHQVAQWAAGGTGGLYRLHAGDLNTLAPRVTHWFAKPVGMTYETLYEILASTIKQTGGSLWQRQMVLSPAPEFCWQCPHDHRLPDSISALTLTMTPLWTGPDEHVDNFVW